LVLLSAALLLVGCSSVPISGPVEYHKLDENSYVNDVQVAPLGPSPGASPQLIVEGFLHAMSVYQPSYEVAREYLTDTANAAWNPDAGVTIYADGYPATVTEDSAVLSAPTVGTLDSGGVYHASSGATIRQDFQLIQNAEGEWRIAQPPDGLLISKSLFIDGYTYFDRHYLSKDGRIMVPDPVWVAAGTERLLRALQLQAHAPSTWVAPLVQYTGRIEVASVTTTGDLVSVELSGWSTELSLDGRRQVMAQLALTCAQFGAYTQLEVSLAGSATPWTVPGLESPTPFREFSEWQPVSNRLTPVVFGVSSADEALVRVRQEGQLSAESAAFAQARAVAVSPERDAAAGVFEGAQLRAGKIADPELEVIREGEGLLRPAYSSLGELWTADASGVAGLMVLDTEADSEPEPEPTAEDSPEPTPDGSSQPTPTPTPTATSTTREPDSEPGDEVEGNPDLEGETPPEEITVSSGVPVTARGAPEGKLIAFSLSPEADRMAVAVETEEGPQVGILRITRGEEVILDGWQPVPLVGMDVNLLLDVSWSQATELFVLVVDHEDSVSVLRVSQDSAQVSDIGPSNPLNLVELASAPGYQLVARDDEGSLYRYDTDFNWTHWVSGIDAVAYSG
jgi:hypothetical protein